MNIVFDCSKSPTNFSQVTAQPEPTASLRVSIIIENVLTSWAAAYAFLPISVFSSAYFANVFVKTSVVIHWLFNASLKLWVASNKSDIFPLAFVVVDLYNSPSFTTVPKAKAVLSNSFLNSTVAIFAFSIDFQSISFT